MQHELNNRVDAIPNLLVRIDCHACRERFRANLMALAPIFMKEQRNAEMQPNIGLKMKMFNTSIFLVE